ncbi:MAG: protease pro-enzyme activation domain-containing protein [Thermoplasmata archaeon]
MQKSYKMGLSVLIISLLIFSGLMVLIPSASAQQSQSTNLFNYQEPGFKDMGPVALNQPVSVIINVPLRDQPLMNTYLREISIPGSSSFGKFLSKAQIEHLFTNQALFNQTLQAMKSSGFQIEFTSLDSMIVARGTAALVKDFFGKQVDIFSNGSVSYYSITGSSYFDGVNILVSNSTNLLFNHPSTFIGPKQISQIKQKLQQLNETFSIEPYPTTSLQNVYNATGLYSQNITGAGKTIGILDFEGNPYIQQQLSYYDQIYGLPNANLTVIPIGPYNPNLGIATGWDGEISMDVEASHTMAPGASIVLYIANDNLPLSAPIAFIDSQDKVNTISQSFSIPESYIANSPAYQPESVSFFFNFILPDYYYELGSLEGITFSASTGDAGGSGYSSGPLGTPGYPSTSPYVTAVGGTTTFLTFKDGNVFSFYQTAWSNYGFVPDNVNYGGSSGGVSMFEPIPWYQSGITVPAGYPNGRMVPDVSLEANVFPGMVFVFGQNQTGISGGTSEASPLFAGLITLIDSKLNRSLGLINPLLYSLGENNSTYSKVYYPITQGYNIPWVEKYGYNLVTGFGAINAGELAYLAGNTIPVNALNITVEAYNPVLNTSFEFPDGSNVTIQATVMNGNITVENGNFSAYLVSLQNRTNPVKMSINKSKGIWETNITLPDGFNGLTYLYVSGNSGNRSGMGFDQLFSGYFVQLDFPQVFSGYYLPLGLPVMGYVSWLNGTGVNTTLNFTISGYSILNNQYYKELYFNTSAFFGEFSTLIYGNNSSLGVSMIEGQNSYLYFPFYNGADLQNTIILGPTEVEPGSVAPGQEIFLMTAIAPPVNYYFDNPNGYYNVMAGSNITYQLINPQGKVINTAFATPFVPSGLTVPSNAKPGLYTIMINTVYNSFSYGPIMGQYFGQILVTGPASVPEVWLNTTNITEGAIVNVYASITENGSEVQYGMYSATLYPATLGSEYYSMTQYTDIPLYYNVSAGLWEGYIIMPSGYNSGSVYFINGLPDMAGAYYLYVTGISADGTAVTNSPTTQYPVYIQNPVIANIENQINSISNNVSSLSSKSKLTQSQIDTLESQINQINSELETLNSSYHVNVTGLENQVRSVQDTLNHSTNTTKSINITAYYAEILAAIALIIAIIAVVISIRKPKN